MARPTEPYGIVARTSPRCAIYTRKSTEEGLDQEFNSLDAQYEACAAYIVSQRHEGWTLLPDRYDDGGFSGGNLDRPGLVRLLADVKADKVDVIVIYKVDRLTRSLADFAKIVEVLDASSASFVSITQSFNTTTSMGRLMLNVLLSFAQFEREVISERVRDKIAASKKKGMWMGGPIPMGYDVVARKLVPNELEAEIVRHIYRRYAAIGSVKTLGEELARTGYRSKEQVWSNGRRRGGEVWARGPLYHLLGNRLYRGEIGHHGKFYPGEHEPIIPLELWDEVQNTLASNRVKRRSTTNVACPSLLAGMVQDARGRPLVASHSNKGGKRYRYYISLPDSAGDPIRLPAGPLEKLVIAGLISALSDAAFLAAELQDHGSTSEVDSAIQRWVGAASSLGAIALDDKRALMIELQVQVAIASAKPMLSIVRAALMGRGGDEGKGGRINIPLPAELGHRPHERRLVYLPKQGAPDDPDRKLIELLVAANAARANLIDGNGTPIEGDAGSRRHQMRLARLSYLAPDIVEAVMVGRQPAALNARRLLREREIPLSWEEQRALFGMA